MRPEARHVRGARLGGQHQPVAAERLQRDADLALAVRVEVRGVDEVDAALAGPDEEPRGLLDADALVLRPVEAVTRGEAAMMLYALLAAGKLI